MTLLIDVIDLRSACCRLVQVIYYIEVVFVLTVEVNSFNVS